MKLWKTLAFAALLAFEGPPVLANGVPNPASYTSPSSNAGPAYFTGTNGILGTVALSGSLGWSGGSLSLNPAAASTLGGVESLSCASHQWFDLLSTAGAFSCAQPAFTDVSGTAALAQGGTGGTTGAAAAKNLSYVYIACAGAPDNGHTGNTSETQLNTTACEIPANTLSAGSVIEVFAYYTFSGTAGTKYVLQRFGTSSGVTGSACSEPTASTSTTSYVVQGWLSVTGSSAESCQNGNGPGGSTNAVVNLTLVTSSNIYVNFDGTLNSSGDTITLVSYFVEVFLSAGN